MYALLFLQRRLRGVCSVLYYLLKHVRQSPEYATVLDLLATEHLFSVNSVVTLYTWIRIWLNIRDWSYTILPQVGWI